jgi:4'-phosphopantetheinyl transferase
VTVTAAAVDIGVPGDVDVWWIDLHRAAVSLEQYLGCLSAAERERVASFRRDDSRVAFAVTRAVLRRLLAARLAVTAHALRFADRRHGKPCLPDHPALEFNVAHTAGLAVVALSRRGPIGVDVERVESHLPIHGLAERCLSTAEIDAFGRLTGDDQVFAFFHAWARKEAFVKALGTGLSHDLASFSVTIAPTEPAMLLGEPSKRWELVALDAGPAYAAALVAPRRAAPCAPRQFTWRDSGSIGTQRHRLRSP